MEKELQEFVAKKVAEWVKQVGPTYYNAQGVEDNFIDFIDWANNDIFDPENDEE